jgi:hypothetical protein
MEGKKQVRAFSAVPPGLSFETGPTTYRIVRAEQEQRVIVRSIPADEGYIDNL